MGFGQTPHANKVNYYSHDGKLVAQDISCGDIITSHTGQKTAVILGFIYNTQTQIIDKIHTATITQDPTAPKSRAVFFIPSSASRNGDVRGMDLPAHIFIDRSHWNDIVDFAREGNRLERIGQVSEEYFKEIVAELKVNHRSSVPQIPADCIYIPSLDYVMDERHKAVPKGLVPYSPVTHYDRALAIRGLSDPSRIVDGDQVHTQYVEDLRALRNAWVKGYLKNKEDIKRSRQLDKAFEKTGAIIPVPVVASKPAIDANSSSFQNSHIVPEQREIIIGNTGESTPLGSLQSSFENRALSRITLPKHLWQGRYLMLKVSELTEDDNAKQGGVVHRPCAVWKAYADKNTKEIVGLELHPVTRSQADKFIFKLPVYPLKTRSERESFLIADCLIRVPLTSEFFHDNANPMFFELTPEKIEKFVAKKRALAVRDGVPHIVGLQDVPDHWEEIELDPTPSLEQLHGWAKNGQIKFDGTLTDRLRDRLKHRSPA